MSVAVAYLTDGTVEAAFVESLAAVRERSGGLLETRLMYQPNTGDIEGGRNRLTTEFLASNAEWLWMVDSDMGFPANALQELHNVADPDDRPIVGALCFGQDTVGYHDGIPTFKQFPTIYTAKNNGLQRVHNYPKGSLAEVDGTGAACLLIHRTVFETLSEEGWDGSWWDRIVWHDHRYSEDLSFCLKAKLDAELPVHVHTGVKTIHVKTCFLDEYSYVHRQTHPTSVVIPVYNNLHLTKHVVGQLVDQGGFDRLLICDNGSTDGTSEWVDQHPHAERLDMPDANIHQMWNAGVNKSLELSDHCNVVILNNDLHLGDRFLRELTSTLRARPYVALCPNYDGRPRTARTVELDGICGGVYDGTGGFAGFAFAVKGGWFANGYRFPEDLSYWYGDNHLLAAIEAEDGTYGMALDVDVEHVGGGGQTGDWQSPEMQDKLAEDRDTYRAMVA